MEKRIPIENLQEGMEVESVFVIRSIEKSKKRNGEDFIRLVLSDATGEINAVAWDNIEGFLNDKIIQQDFIRVKGVIGRFQNQLQLKVLKAEKVNKTEIDLSEFVPITPFDIEQLKQTLFDFIERVKDSDYRRVLDAFFKDAEFLKEFCHAPSAKTMHQAYVGGLLEHTVGVCKNAVAIADNYPGCNYDLLITGALLHDIGKTKEFQITHTIDYTDDGRLRGHIIIGIEMLTRKLEAQPDFPTEKRILLEHLILSHHGQREWGSPRRPKTMEALILHWADYIDAYMSTYLEVVKKCKDKGVRWSDWNRMFERYLFAGFEEPLEALAPKEDDQGPAIPDSEDEEEEI